MKRLLVGLAAGAAMVFGLSGAGSAQNWNHAQRQMACPPGDRPDCGYGAHASCSGYGWLCKADGLGGGGGGGSSSYGAPRQVENCMASVAPVCVAGWLPRCSSGRWRCVPP